jgi:hypothetical protein
MYTFFLYKKHVSKQGGGIEKPVAAIPSNEQGRGSPKIDIRE